MNIEELIAKARQDGASDIHLVVGIPPRYRIDGVLQDMPGTQVLTTDDTETLAREIAGEGYEAIQKIGELDLARTFSGVRVRVNIFRASDATSIALRILSDTIPELDSLGLPSAVLDFPRMRRGIILVTGETGSGKSTTLASILNRINQTRTDHIITMEDPIEYIYKPQSCVINQREIGTDTACYDDALRAVLREDPDVILIGEMRDLNTIETALVAAETGHLVFATLHTNSAADSIDRIVDVFPAGLQKQIRMQASTCLQAVLSQQLVPRVSGGRVVACELMMVTPAIRNLIREGKTPQIANALSTGGDVGSVTMDNALIKLYNEHVIDAQTARDASHDYDYVAKNTF